jgi:DNA-binding NarL/FixJ family response regulator
LETQPVVDPQTSQGRSIDVLIVEDWAPDAELLVHELRRGGFAPVWHRVDSEGEYVGRLDPPPDVVLADYSLPQFGAVRALELLRERQIDVPLIIVSGVIGEEVAVSMMAMGASDYLLKDRLARLSDAVRLAMAQKRLRDEKRRAERALRRSEERHRLLLHNIDEIVYVTEPGQPGRMTFVNERVQHILGYDPEELIVDPARCSTSSIQRTAPRSIGQTFPRAPRSREATGRATSRRATTDGSRNARSRGRTRQAGSSGSWAWPVT